MLIGEGESRQKEEGDKGAGKGRAEEKGPAGGALGPARIAAPPNILRASKGSASAEDHS